MLKKIFIFLYLTVNSTIMVSAEEIDYNARALVGATEQVLITSEIAAKINNIGFTNGEPFLKGDILIAFDCELFEAQREVIQANLDSADVQLKNDKELFNMRSIGELQYELSINGLKKAKAELLIANLTILNRTRTTTTTGTSKVKPKARNVVMAKLRYLSISVLISAPKGSL